MDNRNQYWMLKPVAEPDDYRDFFINGIACYPTRMPSNRCNCCNVVFPGGATTLSFRCPTEAKKLLDRFGSSPVSTTEFQRLRQAMERDLRIHGHDVSLTPGDQFQPLQWEVPSIPRGDFFWPSVHHIIVSDRVRDQFVSDGIDGVEFGEVEFGRVGAYEATHPIPTHRLGDPLDLFDAVPLFADVHSLGNYHVLLVKLWTYMLAAYAEKKCAACGYPTLEDVAVPLTCGTNRLTRKFIPATDIFVSHEVCATVLSDRLAQSIKRSGFSGCTLEPVAVET